MTSLGYVACGAALGAIAFFSWEVWVYFRASAKLRRHIASAYPTRVVTFERRSQTR